MSTKNYNKDWSDCFILDETSPSGLARTRNQYGEVIEKYNVGSKHFKKNNKPHAWELRFKCEKYSVHRIIWVMTYGSIDPSLVIDHLDGDPFNNKIENLSLKTISANMRNQRKYVSNTTGITGVRLAHNGSGNWYYEASWYDVGNKKCQKRFSISKLGEEVAKSLAIDCRKEQIARRISEGAEYTERHGTELLILNKQENK